MKLKNYILTLVFMMLISGCAGMNPNPGERSTDMAWTSNRFEQAFKLAKAPAENGYPWAQLRLGIFYSNGWGVEKNNQAALEWYKKAMSQKSNNKWAKGVTVGVSGKSGMFNQNSDAIIAEFNIAQLYLEGDGVEKNLPLALKHISNVISETNGQSVFFCCDFSGGRYFTQKQFSELKEKIEKEME